VGTTEEPEGLSDDGGAAEALDGDFVIGRGQYCGRSGGEEEEESEKGAG